MRAEDIDGDSDLTWLLCFPELKPCALLLGYTLLSDTQNKTQEIRK